MANELTGDFDVVTLFAMPAVNRLLAAMHRVERFPHSLAMRVEDVTPRGPHFDVPTVSAVSDGYGEPVVNHQRIGRPVFSPEVIFGGSDSSRWRGPLVNIDLEDIQVEPIVPSQLRGHAQVQLFPPTVEIADPAASSLTVKVGMMSRYLPDPGSPAVAEFVRGEMKITAPVSQVATQVANVVNIDVRSAASSVAFTPHWSSSPITPADRAGIDQLMRNALRTSFLPSNIVLPASLGRIQFKAMPGAVPAIAALIDSTGPAGNAATATSVFLSGSDDFAFAASEGYVKGAFQPAIDEILNTPVEPFSFSINLLLTTYRVTYQVTLVSAAVELRQGSILLTIHGRARTGSSVAPNFDFTVKQPFTLTVSGSSVELEVGELSLDTSSWIADRFRGGAISRIGRVRDRALNQSGARASVRSLLDADERLGGFFRSLLTPAEGRPAPPGKGYALAYSSVEIRPAGIVVHGSLAVAAWPPPSVAFEQVPASSGPAGAIGGALASGPDYSALRSWIPGGTIDRYEWSYLGRGTGATEENKFIYRQSPVSDSVMARTVSVGGYSPLCLTVHGRRLTASGAVQNQAVAASACVFSSFPLIDLVSAQSGSVPSIALASPGRDGRVRVSGHMSAGIDETGSSAPNLVIHFPEDVADGAPEALSSALAASGRVDAATAIILVAPAGELERARFAPGIVYAEDTEGSWTRRYDAADIRRPFTIVADPRGKVLERHHGPLDEEALAALLRRTLVTRRATEATIRVSRARTGVAAPNFLIGNGDGRDITLRKLAGRPVTLVFFSSSSASSVAFARKELSAAPGRGAVAIGIADAPDGVEPGQLTIQAGIDAGVIRDSGRRIAAAYGVSIWPSVVHIDEAGTIRSVQAGFDKPIDHDAKGERSS